MIFAVAPQLLGQLIRIHRLRDGRDDLAAHAVDHRGGVSSPRFEAVVTDCGTSRDTVGR